jgi:riboflavin kinase / FMN adenylyltransferase
MKVLDIHQLSEKIPEAIVTSGTFDGVHVGHKKILEGIANQAKKNNGNSVALTFWPHPRFILNPDEKALRLLSTFEEKASLIGAVNIDYPIKIPFTEEFSQLTSEQFVHQILIERLGTKRLVIGYDHHFGKDRAGSLKFLQRNKERFGFEVQEIPRQDIDHVGVSSTKIRTALEQGQVHLASEYLGHQYSITGTVISGDKLGSKIGFPTANISISENYKLIPGDGVYAVKVEVNGQEYIGMLNIGFRPTINSKGRKVEVNIFDFSDDIYDESVTIKFVKRIRNETKFDGLDSLKKQLIRDKASSLKILIR